LLSRFKDIEERAMLNRIRLLCGLCLSCAALVVPVAAQEPATLVLRSGERVSGELLDHGGVGFTVRVHGQERQFPTSEVVVVEFAPGNPSPEVRTRLRGGAPVLVLRNGAVMEARLTDVSGSRPVRVSFDTANGLRDFPSSEIAQIFLSNPAENGLAPAVEPPPAGQRTVQVDARQPWTDSGLVVRAGERIAFNATGDIDVLTGQGMSAGPAGTPAVKGNYPVAGASAGALIARVGTGRPFLVGSSAEPIRMPANGRLFLGINDDHLGDNSGAFTVGLTSQGRTR
jgi:hypothetical protein